MNSRIVKTLISFLITLPFFAQSQHLIEATKLGTTSKLTINLTGLTTADYSVDHYYVTYYTSDVNGDSSIASGLMCIPNEIECDSVPLAVYDHGTVLLKTDVPSSSNTESLLGKAISSRGFVVVMPDYVGLGIQSTFHPYQHASTEATATVDMLYAAKEFIADSASFNFSNEVFITGYSQGGHSAMATAKYIQDNGLLNDLPVAGLAPMSGAYYASKNQMDPLVDNVPYPTPGYVVYLLFAYQEAYGNIYQNYSEILQPPYDSIVPPLMDGTHPISDVHAVLPNLTSLYLDSTFLNDLIADSITQTQPLTIALLDNDNYDWTPVMPTTLIYCSADEQVNPQNSLDAYQAMSDNGATELGLENMGALSHSGCIVPATTRTIDLFDAWRKECTTVSSVKKLAVKSLSVYPTPAQDWIQIDGVNNPQATVQVFDITGNLLLETKMDNGKVNISNLTNGTYIISVITKDETFVTKFIRHE